MIRRAILEAGLALTVLFATTAFGASPEWASGVFVTASYFLFVLYLFPFHADQSLERPSPKACLAVGILAAIPVAQLIPLPAWFLRLVSPVHDAFVTPLLREGLLPDSLFRGMASVCPFATWIQLRVFVAVLILFLIGRALFADAGSRSRFLGLLAVIGLFQASFGLLQYFGVFPQFLPDGTDRAIQCASGTYVNRDHFSGLLEMCIPVLLGLAYTYFATRILPEIPYVTTRISEAFFHHRTPLFLLLIFLAAIMGLGVVFSLSRSGIFCLTATVVFLAVLVFNKHRRGKVNAFVLSFAFLVLGYSAWIGVDEVLRRFGQLATRDVLNADSRFQAWQDTLELVRDYPVTGTGLGTFYYAFNRYESVPGERVFTHAHNDYLEYVAELGAPGGLFLIVCVVFLLVRGVRIFFRTSNPRLSGVSLGACGAVFAILLHSVTDFNLQIPANMAVFSLLLAVLASVAVVHRREEALAPPAEDEEAETEDLGPEEDYDEDDFIHDD
ncbi:MAG: O-antigen ligase family protein [Acidobacteria bacterium]|nr:O-antigen ligase family protein [Acidobacteriota bacterium]